MPSRIAPARGAMLRVLTTVSQAALSSNKVFVPPASGHVFRLFLLLALAEEDGRVESIGDLMRLLDIGRSAVSRTVASFVQSGAMRTSEGVKDDQKTTTVHLTALGRAFVNETLEAMKKAIYEEQDRAGTVIMEAPLETRYPRKGFTGRS